MSSVAEPGNATQDQTANCQVQTDSLNTQEVLRGNQAEDHTTTKDQTANCQVQIDSLNSLEVLHDNQREDGTTTKDQTANCQIQIDSLNSLEVLHKNQREDGATTQDQTANCQIQIDSLNSPEVLHGNQKEDTSLSVMAPSKKNSTGPSCVGHDHFPMVMLNEIFSINVDQMFELIFTDSCVQRMLAERRNRSDVVWFPWRSEANGTKRRNVTYLVSVRYKLRPKTFRFTEKQVLYSESRPGHLYFVDAECISLGVPYGSNFSVVNRCYISRISDDKCQLCITCKINYHKNTWVPVKNFISKMAVDGILKNFQVLAELLRKKDSLFSDPNLSSISQNSGSETSLTPICDSSSKHPLHEASTEYVEDTSALTTGIIYFFFTCSLVCVVCITGVLFYGLWASVDNISIASVEELNNRRLSHQYSRPPPVETVADDLAAQLSEMLSSSAKLIEAVAETLEELSENESKIQQCLKERHSCPSN